MSYAGARINEIFTTVFERHDPIEPMEELVAHISGDVWRIMHWHVDLVILGSCFDELTHLLDDYRREPDEVNHTASVRARISGRHALA